nr:glycosyltransferase [Nodosilinea sp. LEGE 06152]
MKFSLVITTYNRLELLKRAIACGLNQTVPCEVVVADDASTDGTEEYVRSLGDRVVYHRNAQNLNHAAIKLRYGCRQLVGWAVPTIEIKLP